MKKKITPIILATVLMLSPISQFNTAFASEDNSKEEIVQTIDNQKAGQDFQVEYDNGDVILKEEENKDVKDVGDVKIKLKDDKGKDVQVEKAEEINKATNDKEKKEEDVKIEETKNTSKEVYNDMKIVSEKDNDKANFVTIVSNTSDNKPLTGFKYKLINNDTKEELELNFTNGSELIAKIPDASYTIKFVSGPEKYSVEDDINFTMPMQDEENKEEYTNQIKIMLKHNTIKEKITENPKTMDDKNILIPILLSIAGIGIIGYIIYNKKKATEH